MNAPRVGLVVPALAQGGGVPAVARFVMRAALRSKRYDLTVISLASSSRDASSVRLARPESWLGGVATRCGNWEGQPFVHVGAMLAELEFQRYRPRKALVEAVSRCDVLQVVCGSPAWAYAVCGAGKPVSLQCATRALVERRRRDARPRAITGWWRKAMTGITDQVDDLALRAVDAIQVENAWMYRYVLDRCAGREVDVRYAPPGVDARSFIPTPVRNLAPDSYILCVGRFDDPRKNVGLLLEAYALIPAPMRSRLRLLLAGETVPPEAFFRRAEALGLRDRVEVSLRPSQDELIALYQEASVFALPSDEEGLGVVLLEAMACGVPVVSTRSGGPEGVITDGEDGYLVPLGDAAALADRIVGLSSDTDLNRAMGMRARATIQARFAEEVAAQPFLEVWERLLSRVGTA